jgi:uncharacterized iron-regulated membrane protein
MPRLTVRRFFLKVHLYVGLTAAAILLCTSLSGSVLAFQPDLDRWLHPALHRVAPAAARRSERDLLALVARTQAPGRDVSAIQRVEFGDTGTSQVFWLRSGARVYVDPYTGAILGTRTNLTALEEFLGGVHQFHVRLLAGNVGEWVVDIATSLLLVLVPSGVYLWWAKKRFAVRRGIGWRQFNWDVHSVAGIWSCAFVLLLALSGVLLAWEAPLYWLVHATPERELPVPHSVVPEGTGRAASAGDADEWLAAAGRALPGQATESLILPTKPRSAVQVVKHGLQGFGRSMVYVDRYDAHVLRVDDFADSPRAVRAHVVDRALHTGEISGLPARVVLALASLALATLIVTGTILWLKRVVT